MGFLEINYLKPEHLAGFDQYKVNDDSGLTLNDFINEILNLQYSAIDTSPLSKYVMHPFWNACVKVCTFKHFKLSCALIMFTFRSVQCGWLPTS